MVKLTVLPLIIRPFIRRTLPIIRVKCHSMIHTSLKRHSYILLVSEILSKDSFIFKFLKFYPLQQLLIIYREFHENELNNCQNPVERILKCFLVVYLEHTENLLDSYISFTWIILHYMCSWICINCCYWNTAILYIFYLFFYIF